MSDYNSSLPVRTQTNGDVVAFLADGTTSTQLLGIDASGRLTIKLDDGSGNLITSQANGVQRALDVGINVAGVQIDPRSIRALTSADVVTANQGGAPWTQNLTQVGGSAIALGQALMAASLPVTIASNQSALAVSQSGTWTVQQGTPPWTIQGDSASGASKAGNPVQIGGVFNTTQPTVTTGQTVEAQSTSRGALIVATGLDAFAVNASQTGTWTVQPGNTANTTAWFVKDNSLGTVAAGTAGTQSSLAGGVYNTSLPTLTTGQQAALQLDSSGRLIISPNSSLLAEDHNYGTVGANTLRTASQVGNATGAADFNSGATGAQTLRVVANQGAANATPWNENVAQFGGNAVVTGTGTSGVGIPRVTVSNDSAILANIQVAGSAVSNTNPVPVTLTTSAPGTAIQNYQTSASLAAGASVTLTYTVVATHTFNFQRAWASASGKIKAVVQNNGSTIFVGFNSTANPNIDFTIISPPTIAAGNTASIIITNEDKAAFDVYATIEGNQN